MKNHQHFGPLALILTAAAFVGWGAAPGAQAQGDFRNAGVAQVRDAQGAIVLQGQFQPVDEEDDDIERKALLTATGADADAKGEAEVEYPKDTPDQQEIEFSIENLQPGATFTFVVDGHDVATATTDSDGDAEVEVAVGAAAAASR